MQLKAGAQTVIPTLGADVLSSSREQTAETQRGLEIKFCRCTNIFGNENKQTHGSNMLLPATMLLGGDKLPESREPEQDPSG